MEQDKIIIEFIGKMRENFFKLKNDADKAISQITKDVELNWQPDADSNSIAIIIRHLAGNMKSRWTDFLTTDGEKQFRKRDMEFDERVILSRDELIALWEEGWKVTINTIESLKQDDMMKLVQIRGENHTVIEALYRQLTHYAAHVGQIFYVSKALKKERWQSLSQPKKRS